MPYFLGVFHVALGEMGPLDSHETLLPPRSLAKEQLLEELNVTIVDLKSRVGTPVRPVVTRVEGGCSAKVRNITPPKIYIEHNHTGLEDHVPF